MDGTLASIYLTLSPHNYRRSSDCALSSEGIGISEIIGNNHALFRQKRSSSHGALGIEPKTATIGCSRTPYLPSALQPAPSIRASENAAKLQDLRESRAMVTAKPLVGGLQQVT
jgi:hypothetical protein